MVLKKIMRNCDQNIQKLWDNTERSNIKLIGIADRAEIQANGIESLFSEIIVEKFPDPGN